MKYKLNFYFFLLILVISPNIAFAYLDPVTGLVIFQAIIAFIATIYATIILKPINNHVEYSLDFDSSFYVYIYGIRCLVFT